MHGAAAALRFDFSDALPPVAFQQLGVHERSLREVKVGRGGDELLYLRVRGVPNGRHWIELDLTKAYQAVGLHLGSLAAAPETQDPSQLLAMLSGAVGKAHDLGATSTDTGTATSYGVTIDLAKALQAKETNGGPPLFVAAAARRKTLPEEVSIGSNGLIRELSATYPIKIRGISMHLTMKLDFLRYGIRSQIRPPASGDTLNLTPLLASSSRA